MRERCARWWERSDRAGKGEGGWRGGRERRQRREADGEREARIGREFGRGFEAKCRTGFEGDREAKGRGVSLTSPASGTSAHWWSPPVRPDLARRLCPPRKSLVHCPECNTSTVTPRRRAQGRERVEGPWGVKLVVELVARRDQARRGERPGVVGFGAGVASEGALTVPSGGRAYEQVGRRARAREKRARRWALAVESARSSARRGQRRQTRASRVLACSLLSSGSRVAFPAPPVAQMATPRTSQSIPPSPCPDRARPLAHSLARPSPDHTPPTPPRTDPTTARTFSPGSHTAHADTLPMPT